MLEINFHDIYFFLYTFVFLPLFSLNGCEDDDEYEGEYGADGFNEQKRSGFCNDLGEYESAAERNVYVETTAGRVLDGLAKYGPPLDVDTGCPYKPQCYDVNISGQVLCETNCKSVLRRETEDAPWIFSYVVCDQAYFSPGNKPTGESMGDGFRSLMEKPNHIHNYVDNNKSYSNTDSEFPNHSHNIRKKKNINRNIKKVSSITSIIIEIQDIILTTLSVSNFFNRKSIIIPKNKILEIYNKYFPDEKFE